MSVDFGVVVPRVPILKGLNAEFYEHARSGRLHVQRCIRCGHFQHPPRHLCRRCSAHTMAWAPVEHVGTLYSWAVTHFPFDRGWAPAIPYTTGVIELREGVRLVAALGSDVALRLGLPVRVVLTPHGDDFVLLSLATMSDGDA